MKLMLPKWMLEFSADLKFHPYPMFVIYKPKQHKVTLEEVRQILNIMEPGDGLLRSFHGYLNTIFTPGIYSHVAIVEDNKTIIHAVGEGVVREDILKFCRCDSLCLFRPIASKEVRLKAVKNASDMVAMQIMYDYEFEAGDDQVYCTEGLNLWYDKIYDQDFSKVAGNSVLTPDGVRLSKQNEILLEYTHTKKGLK